MKRNSYVYKHTRLDKNEVFYIGIGKAKNYKRAYSHGNRNKWWKYIVNKTDYKVEIVEDNLTWNEACELETELIKKYGRKDLSEGTLVNLTDGGDGRKGTVYTEETIEKIRIANTGKKHTEETKRKQSEANKGENNPFYGKAHSEETIEKLRKANTGKKHTEETKRKQSEANKGENHPMYGKTHTDESIEKIRKGNIGTNKRGKNPFAQPYEVDGEYFGCRLDVEEHFGKAFLTIKKYYNVIKLDRVNGKVKRRY